MFDDEGRTGVNNISLVLGDWMAEGVIVSEVQQLRRGVLGF